MRKICTIEKIQFWRLMKHIYIIVIFHNYIFIIFKLRITCVFL